MTREPYITAESSPAGTFYRASRWDADGSTLTVGPSASSPSAAAVELDRDAGGATTYARPRLPGEPTFRAKPSTLALIASLMVSGCATLSVSDVLEESRARTEQARQALEGVALVVATARSFCDAAGDKAPDECRLLADVPIDRARDALRDAAAAEMTAAEVMQSLAPYAEAARAVVARGDAP